jgi:hypothetical protein
MSLAFVIVACVAVFGGGVAFGVIALVSVAVRREDRRSTLRGDAPGVVSRGARRLTGIEWRPYV